MNGQNNNKYKNPPIFITFGYYQKWLNNNCCNNQTKWLTSTTTVVTTNNIITTSSLAIQWLVFMHNKPWQNIREHVKNATPRPSPTKCNLPLKQQQQQLSYNKQTDNDQMVEMPMLNPDCPEHHLLLHHVPWHAMITSIRIITPGRLVFHTMVFGNSHNLTAPHPAFGNELFFGVVFLVSHRLWAKPTLRQWPMLQ